MKLGKIMILGICGFILIGAKTAAAQSVPNVTPIVEKICGNLIEEFKGSDNGKCQDYLLNCETSLTTLKDDLIKQNGCLSRQLVDCPPDSVVQDCFQTFVDFECAEKSLNEAIEKIKNQISGECNSDPSEIPPTDPQGPKDPKDPQDPKNPEPPVVKPEQPKAPTDPFQVGDDDQGQAAAGLFQLSGSGCSLNLAGAPSATFFNGIWLLLPMLGLRKKK